MSNGEQEVTNPGEAGDSSKGFSIKGEFAKRKDYLTAMDSKLKERKKASARDFWESKGEFGSFVAVVSQADADLEQAMNAGDPVAVKKAKTVVHNLGGSSQMGELQVNWLGSCFGVGAKEVNPVTGLPTWAEKLMPVKPAAVVITPVVK